MTRENKLALVVGFALILFVGILISDHFSAARVQEAADLRPQDPLAATASLQAGPDLLSFDPPKSPNRDADQARPRQDPGRQNQDRQVSRPRETTPAPPPRAELPLPEDPLNDPNAPRVRTHTVRSGETLTSICDQYYGDDRLYLKLAKFNGMPNPNALSIGDKLEVPDREQLDGGAPAATPALGTAEPTAPPAPREAPVRTYTVRDGDVLSEIARRELGSAARWQELYDANRDVIADPDRLQVGVVLRIPAG